MTTIKTITPAQIRSLRDAAGAAGDLAQVAICDRALNGSVRATRECVRVIREGEAQI